jgi:hypothetical protein
VRKEQHTGIGQYEAIDHNFGRLQPMLKEYFGRYKSGTPHDDGEEGNEMIEQCAVLEHDFSRFQGYKDRDFLELFH